MGSIAHIQFPSSIGPTMAAVQAIAIALAYVAPQVKAAAGASKAAEHLRTASVRAVGEFQVLLEAIEQVNKVPTVLDDEERPHLDRIAETRTLMYGVRDTFQRAMNAAIDVKSAIANARKHDQILSFANRDWRKMSSEGAKIVAELEHQVASTDVYRLLDEAIRSVDELFGKAHELTAAGELPLHEEHPEASVHASEGFDAWLAALPPDDWSDAVDSEAPLRWLDGQGWVER